MRTHVLGTAQEGTSQDMERNQPSNAHSRPGDRTGRDKSGHGKKLTERCALTNWRPHRKGQVRHRKKLTERCALTFWRPHRKGQVRTGKETDRAMRTHVLGTAQGGTSQDRERNRPSDAHSRPGDRTGRDKSGHRNKPTERCALTNWRPAKGRTSQENERKA